VKTACELQLCRVYESDGVLLGRVFDIRCAWRDGNLVVTDLVYGRSGLLERLGFRKPRCDTLPWSAVIRMEERAIVVAAPRRR